MVVDESGVPIPQGTPQVAKMVLRDASADAAFISRLFPEDAAHYTMVAADGTTVRCTSPHRHQRSSLVCTLSLTPGPLGALTVVPSLLLVPPTPPLPHTPTPLPPRVVSCMVVLRGLWVTEVSHTSVFPYVCRFSPPALYPPSLQLPLSPPVTTFPELQPQL